MNVTLGFSLLALAVLARSAGAAIGVYDRHVLFDNSLPDRGYDNSQSYLVAPSTLEAADAKFPVHADHFVSPPNSLRLRWKSAPGGDWRMTLEISRRYARPFQFEGDTLTFWCHPDTDITAANSPRLFLQDANGVRSSGQGCVREHGSFLAAFGNNCHQLPNR